MKEYSDEMAIILPACDRYLDVVAEYVRYLKMNWNDCPFEVILVTETKKYNDDRISSYTTSETTQWTGRVLEGLKHTTCPYVLVMIEDAFFSKTVNNQIVFDILDFMKKKGIKYYRNPKNGHTRTNDNSFTDFEYACKIEKSGVYNRSLGIDIWDRNALKLFFGDGTMSAWDVEQVFLADAVKGEKGYFEDWVSDTRNFLNVIETVSGGKWMRQPIKQFEKLGIPVNLGEREMHSRTDSIKRRIHRIANIIVPQKLRAPVKAFFSKFGYKFATKY